MSAPVRYHDPVCLDALRDRFFFLDDFHGDQLQDTWNESGDAGGSADPVAGEEGGVVRITTNAANTDYWAIDWDDHRTLHVDKNLIFEVRAKIDDVADSYFYFYLTKGSTDWIVLRTNGDPNWKFFSRDDTVTTEEDTGIAADTGWHTFRIECSSTELRVYIDDVLGATINTNIPADADDFLQPRIQAYSKEAVAHSIDVDYIAISQDR